MNMSVIYEVFKKEEISVLQYALMNFNSKLGALQAHFFVLLFVCLTG